MAKRARKAKISAEETELREAQRIAAYEEVAAEPIVETEQENEEVQETEAAVESSESNTQAGEVDGENEQGVEGPQDQTEEEEKVVNTVVHEKYKNQYVANAAALGETKKAAKRSNWDWLAQRIAEECLDEKGKISITGFTELLDLNGVDHSKWTNRNQGWEGRFRMTGRVVLQKVVANTGVLVARNEHRLEAPLPFIEKYKTKA